GAQGFGDMGPMKQTVSANIVDVVNRRIFGGTVHINHGRIDRIEPSDQSYDTYLIPGFVDAHVHIESSMLVPTEFARLASVHGTVATVSDPHEIANVLGVRGVEYMIDNANASPMKFYFGAPACVPATCFETAGASLGVEEVSELLGRPEIRYLSEVMNFPGVISGDEDMHGKIAAARRLNKRVDGHAPGLRGEPARQYFAAGVETDHECYTLEEAIEKLSLGVKILIREGSAARNFNALWPLMRDHADACMLCTDDMHPDNLLRGHIDRLVAQAVAHGVDPMNALQCACVNPVRHYGLDVGLLRAGDPADFAEIRDLNSFQVLRTWIDGKLVAAAGQSLTESGGIHSINHFDAVEKKPADFFVPRKSQVRIIEAADGQLVTQSTTGSPQDPDVLKLTVVERYGNGNIGIGFIRGFGLKRGAIASSVAHDCHNIVAVGADDDALCRAVNAVIRNRGALVVIDGSAEHVLPLPIAGIISDRQGQDVAHQYGELDRLAKGLGSALHAPFMTLSFMALLVIPSLKLSDRGLFDGERFELVEL
ncbi:MAG TPA: adenine deaminase, partial [Tepidisphaeraceae bacterium]|nr:adenine deaminase [Tepidisphaeraceae bacterium]